MAVEPKIESGGREPRIAIVVAVAENGVIGRDGAMPWRIPGELASFRRLTLGKPVIMGRKTFLSLGKPLAGRDNIVVSRQRGLVVPGGVEVAADLAAALALARSHAARRGVDWIMIIGGAAIYRAALPHAERIYLTRVHLAPAGDTHFPELEPGAWREVASEAHAVTGQGAAWSLVTLDRNAVHKDTAKAP